MEAKLDRLSMAVRQHLTFRIGINWTLPPADLNAALSDVIRWIELDPATFRPCALVWTRQLVTGNGDLDGNVEPDPEAERVDGGWRLRFERGASGASATTS